MPTIDSDSDDNEIVTGVKWGLIEGRSIEGILLKLTKTGKKSIGNGLIFGVDFIDCQRAFDTVSHEIMSHLHAFIMNYLTDRTQYAGYPYIWGIAFFRKIWKISGNFWSWLFCEVRYG